MRARKLVPLQTIWIKAPNHVATHPIESKVIKGDDGYSLLYGTSLESAVAVFVSAAKEESLTIGFRRLGQANDELFYGVTKMTPLELNQVQQCLKELLPRIK
jgi:hypothetical protein